MSTIEPLKPSDLAGADIQIKEEIKRQAEAFLAAQLQSGIAADQRAMSFVSLMAAAAVVVAGGGAALLLGTPVRPFLGWVCIGTATSFALAMGAAVETAKPVDFHYVGGAPKDWKDDLSNRITYEDALAEFIINLGDRIKFNKKILETNALWMWRAVRIAWGGLGIGGALAIGGLLFR
ncbi:hypothetical protein [Methylobacterium sp. Leaf108]|uniref:hypothetical protein n=1 Tax=Methylobacterium sp. Leaf108 TaxID=1736256 RepID=UPI000A4F4D7E|nr:hypothetical protein [Methylobacterium sp. Leaf108]